MDDDLLNVAVDATDTKKPVRKAGARRWAAWWLEVGALVLAAITAMLS